MKKYRKDVLILFLEVNHAKIIYFSRAKDLQYLDGLN